MELTLTSQYFTTNDGIQLHAKVAGQGPLVVLLHGFPEYWYAWRHQIPVLAQHFTVVAPDLRGYNLSAKPKEVKHYSIEKLTNDVSTIIDAMGYQKAIVVGHDWGGVIAWTFAAYFPEKVEKFIVLNMPNPAALKKQLKSNPRQLLRSYYIFLFQLPYLPEWFMRLRLEKIIHKTFIGWAHNPNAFSEEDVAKYTRALARPGAITASINYYRALFRYSKRSDNLKPHKLSMPVLFIFGEDDRALGKETTYTTHKYCSSKPQIHYIENCSHWVQHEYPDRVNQLIMDFLKE